MRFVDGSGHVGHYQWDWLSEHIDSHWDRVVAIVHGLDHAVVSVDLRILLSVVFRVIFKLIFKNSVVSLTTL